MFKTVKIKNIIVRSLIITVAVLLTINVIPANASDNSIQESAYQEELSTNENEIPADEDDESTSAGAIEEADDEETDEESVTNQAISEPAIENHVVTQKAITPMATEISSTAIVVDNFAELKTYLEGNNTYTEFYFGANIVQTSGITVNSSKNNVTISGKNPDTGTMYKYTELNSVSITGSITVSGNARITIKDMIIDGYNYYGTVSSDVLPANSGVVIKYDNVDYNGPQLCFAPYSTLHIKDSNIVIPENIKGFSANQEVGEVGSLILEGYTNITKHNNNGIYSTFWMPNYTSNAELKIIGGSNVNISSELYFIYSVNGNIDINIETGASLTCNVKGGMTYIDQRLGSINVGDNAIFKYYHTGNNGSYRTASLRGNFNVGQGATLDMRRTQSSYNATVQTRILINLVTASSEINFNNPERVILVNGITTNPEGVISFTSGGRLNIYANAINLWETLPSGFASNIMWNDPMDTWNSGELPTKVWNEYGFNPIQISAVYTSTNVVKPSSVNVSGGYSPATSKNIQTLVSDNFLGSGSKVFTLGSTYLGFSSLYTDSVSINGEAPAGTYVTVEYENNDGNQSDSVITDNDGVFSISTGGNLIEASTVSGVNQKNFLRGYNYAEVMKSAGLLRFNNVPSIISFYSSFMPIEATIIPREYAGWSISVEDTRDVGDTWNIYASIEAPLSAQNEDGIHTLPNALIYRTGSGTEIFGSDNILIYSGQTVNKDEGGISTINWSSDEGPLVSISDNDTLFSNTNYTTTIKWTLVDGPQ